MGAHPALVERFGDAEGLQKAIDTYFHGLVYDEDGEKLDHPTPATFSDLALLLGFDSAVSVWNYATAPDGSERAEFREPIKSALCRIDGQYERRLASGKPVGSIFALKNRGWTDQQNVTHELAGSGWGDLLAGLNTPKTAEDAAIEDEDDGA